MQKRFAGALLRLSAVMMALSAISHDIYARPLSADQALAALGCRPSLKAVSEAGSPMTLSYTVSDDMSGLPAVYVFSREGSEGFCIAAADDAVGDILLGYSPQSRFSACGMAPGMRWLLEMYAARVAGATSPYPRRVARPEVEPLSTTMWAQDAPFNDMCPVLSDSRTPVGCVAVAMAQLLKVYQWPVAGTGQKEYAYSLDMDGEPLTISVSSDFASHTYRWADMLDSYVYGSTPAQREAVAQLAFDCGVASSTEYSASSSARSFDAGRGMIEHFAYDKGMRYVDRKWFSYRDWEAMIYDQLRQGRPVMYSGYSSITGHTFLIDGVDSDGFFHFNWGWYGVSDGYYSLADLSPEDPGDVTHSFNSGQIMLVDLIPDAGSPFLGSMAIADVLSTNKTVYHSDTDYINVLGGFYSFALGDMDYTLGFMADTDTPKYIKVLNSMLSPTWGYTQLSVFAGNFPEGEYDVYPVFKTETGEWQKMYFDRGLTSGHLHFVNRDGVITVTSGEMAPVGGHVVSAVYAGAEPADGLEPRFFPGREYEFIFDIDADGECVSEMLVELVGADGAVVASSTHVVLDFAEAASERVAFPLELPASLGEGDYRLACMMLSDGESVAASDWTSVEVLQEWITLDITSVDLHIGDECQLVATTHSSLIPVLWSSSHPAVAEVDASGLVRVLAEGEACITASCGNASAVCYVSALAGIAGVEADRVSVAASAGMVHVSAPAGTEVAVYGSDGALRCRGVLRDIPVPSGAVYFVAVGGTVFKVAVD